MPVRGAKPKPEGQKVGRAKVVQPFKEVENKPYDGPRMPLPEGVYFHPIVVSWYESVSTMPHCALWDDSDWQYLIATALVYADLVDRMVQKQPFTALATELRYREKQMGTTWDARRDLRIKYVDQARGQEDRGPEIHPVTKMSDYRELYGEK